jgi:hypothetical protein
MKEISPSDASLLVLIGQIAEGDPGTDLIEQLSSETAKEIGRAVVAKDSQRREFSKDAWTTAQELKWWRMKSAEQRVADSLAAPGMISEVAEAPLRARTPKPAMASLRRSRSLPAPGSRARRAPGSRSRPGRPSR